MKYLNKPWFIALLMLPFLNPAAFEYISVLKFVDSILDAMKVISAAVIIYLYIRSNKLSPIILTVILYQASLLLSTVISRGNYWKLAVNCGSVIAFCMLLEMGIKNNSRVIMQTIQDLYVILVSINTLLLILFPSGLVDKADNELYYFLGIRNLLPPILIPVMAVSVIASEFGKKNSKAKNIALCGVMIPFTILITWSATGVVGWFVFTAYYVLVYRRNLSITLNSAVLGAGYILAFITIVLMRLHVYFSYIIETILHKNITLTGRTELWDYVFLLIKRSPIFGYGVYSNLIYYRNIYFSHAHNGLLEVMLEGGIPALVLFLAMFFLACLSLYKERKRYITGIATAGLFSFMIMLLVEGYVYHIWLFGLMTISFNVSAIASQLDSEKKESAPKTESLRTRYISYRLGRH